MAKSSAPRQQGRDGSYVDLTDDINNNNTNNNNSTPSSRTNRPRPPDGMVIPQGRTRTRTRTKTRTSPSKPLTQSGLFGASSNLVNSIVGAGIIGIPYALKESGLIAGVFLLILVGWMTDKSLRIIVEIATFHPKLKSRDVFSFEDLMSYPFGRFGSYFVLANMFVLAYGAMVAYLLIIKDTVPVLIGYGNSAAERNLVMFLTSVIIILPLSMQRDMATLAFSSTLSVFADVILVVFVAVFAPIAQTLSQNGGIWEVLKDDWVNPTLFIGYGILGTAMACQHSAFIVSGSLKDMTKKRWATVTCTSLTLSTIMCSILGVAGYLGYLSDTQGDILNNFPNQTAEATGARALLAITMFFTYPMECFVARHVLIKLFYNGDLDGPRHETTGRLQAEYCCGCLIRRHAVTIAIFVATMIPGLAFTSLGTVLSVTGSIGASSLSYIAPGLVYLGLNGDDFIRRATASCQKRTTSSTAMKTATAHADLPVEGDAKQTMELPNGDGDTTSTMTDTTSSIEYPSGKKPWWWFPALMPIWCSLAIGGVERTRDRLEREDILFQEMGSSPSTTTNTTTRNQRPAAPPPPGEETIPPRVSDYAIAIFFILFGVVGGIAGITSNIYSFF